ncbi:hypothetical protein, partial [Morganella morganii]|uniref:hypothetical protein n=1 Tax=Morganella morganii TaxID=582 RepID=UPI0005FB852B
TFYRVRDGHVSDLRGIADEKSGCAFRYASTAASSGSPEGQIRPYPVDCPLLFILFMMIKDG